MRPQVFGGSSHQLCEGESAHWKINGIKWKKRQNQIIFVWYQGLFWNIYLLVKCGLILIPSFYSYRPLVSWINQLISACFCFSIDQISVWMILLCCVWFEYCTSGQNTHTHTLSWQKQVTLVVFFSSSSTLVLINLRCVLRYHLKLNSNWKQ